MRRRRLPPSVWSAFAWLTTAAYTFITSAIIYRFIGPGEFGIWATVLVLRGFLLVVEGGLSISITRDVALQASGAAGAQERAAAAGALFTAASVGALLVAVAAASAPAALLRLEPGAAQAARWVSMCVGLEAALVFTAGRLTAAMRGRERYDQVALVAAVQATVAITLVLVLAPRWGLIGAALAAVLGRAAGLIPAAWIHVSHRRRDATAPRPGRAAFRAVLAVALPLWTMAISEQIAAGTDVPIVGSFHGAEQASHYSLGQLLPRFGAGLLFSVMAVFFPRLATAGDAGLARVIPKLAFKACVLAALGFGVLILLRQAVLQVWVGGAPTLSQRVLLLYALAWTCNAVTHVLCLAAVARGKHAIIMATVIPESVVSFSASIWLAASWGPHAPAVVTLGVAAVTNLFVVPLLLLRRLRVPGLPFARAALTGLAIGAALAAVVSLPTRLIHHPLGQVLAGGAATVAAAAALYRLLLANAVAPRRLTILLGGVWDLVRREGAEVREARSRLAALRSRSPDLWLPAEAPLVTVTIATYNRGPLIVERAIDSALRQTHTNVEIVVVGDCCDQATADAVLAVKDPRVRFENLPVRGPYPADPWALWRVAGTPPLNRAMELARGDWIAPLDDDDEFMPDHIEVLLDASRRRRLEFAYGIAEVEVAPGRWGRVGSWPPREGRIAHQAILYWAGLRFLRYDIECWRLEEPGDWNRWRRMRRSGVRMGFVPHVVCRHYLEGRNVRAPGAAAGLLTSHGV